MGSSTKWPRWSNADIDALKELYPDNPNETVADAIGRTTGSVHVRAMMLRLRKSRKYIMENRMRRGIPAYRKVLDCMPNPLVKIRELNRRFGYGNGVGNICAIERGKGGV